MFLLNFIILEKISLLPQPDCSTTSLKTLSLPIKIFDSLCFRKLYPTKIKNVDIQTEVSSQFGFNTINSTIYKIPEYLHPLSFSN